MPMSGEDFTEEEADDEQLVRRQPLGPARRSASATSTLLLLLPLVMIFYKTFEHGIWRRRSTRSPRPTACTR